MLTVDDLLSIRHPEEPRWLDDTTVAFAYRVDGRREIHAMETEGSSQVRLSPAGESISAWHAHPATGIVAMAAGDRLWLGGRDASPKRVAHGEGAIEHVAWDGAGSRVAILRGGRLELLDREGGVSVLPLPARAVPAALWSPDGRHLACFTLADGNRRDLAVVEADTGELVWSCETEASETTAAWLDRERIVVTRCAMNFQWREYVLIEVTSGRERIIEREASEKGFFALPGPVASPDGSAIALTAHDRGWAHVILHELSDGRRVVPLPGPHEDYGQLEEQPTFSPDSRYLAFSSSRGDLRQRQLWCHDRKTGETWPLTSRPGNSIRAAWSPDGSSIAHIHSGPHNSPEVALVGRSDRAVETLTDSMPPAWRAVGTVAPEYVTYESKGGFVVHADLYAPPGLDRRERHPAIVYVHGGVYQQMRNGWHPSFAYSMLHGINQLLLKRGYVVLSVEYRGSTGFGLDYDQANYLECGRGDVEDCVSGARYLASLEFVDPERIGIWGLSYGGTMTLAALAKHPDVFAMGLNLAGIWDMEQRAGFYARQKPGEPVYFISRWGGPRGPHNDHIYEEMSARNYVAQLEAPLLNLQGTADEAVDFQQLDLIIRDCTDHAKDFAALYYPDETHVFNKRSTWADAVPRILAAFDRYLRCDPAERPRAML